MTTRTLYLALLAGAMTLPLGCGATAPAPSAPEKVTPNEVAAPRPTAEDAEQFVLEVEAGLLRIWAARDRAAWVNQTFITEDTEALVAAAEEATAEYVRDAIERAKQFEGLELSPEVARKLHLLRLAETVPAPSAPEKRSELARLQAFMTGAYGKGKYCPEEGSKLSSYAKDGACLTLDDLSRVLRTSRKSDELREAWLGWHGTGAQLKDSYARYVELGNEGAREIGFADMGALWRAGYDMPPDELEADVDRLWQQVKPLYDKLHCHVRARLRSAYGEREIGAEAPLPAHLLGNMWAQDWSYVYDLVAPYPKEPSLDASRKLEKDGWSAVRMVQLGERFFGSLGFDPLPQSFWQRSLLTRPKDRDVVCHASAWDVASSGDLRIKMCISPNEEDLVTIHHELGHIFYYQRYGHLPILFQTGANDGFHEGIGDTIALSITPNYLKEVGLLDRVPNDDRAALNQQMKVALEKVAFLPFGLVIDKWRWDVLAGKVSKDQYNSSFWELRRAYQGVTPPVERTDADFDAGAKYHIPASTPYLRYFLAHIYQFQFHRALCKASGHQGPLPTCSIFGKQEAGEKLRAMLALGASQPWQEAMKVLGGETRADASALLEYFAPLEGWLDHAIQGEKCGW